MAANKRIMYKAYCRVCNQLRMIATYDPADSKQRGQCANDVRRAVANGFRILEVKADKAKLEDFCTCKY